MAKTGPVRPVLMVGLDAAEPSLIEHWIKEGDLPNLKAILVDGCYGRLSSSAQWLAGSPWPTFFTGTGPAEHGRYHNLQWSGERMTHVRVGTELLPARPFWRESGFKDRRVITIDIPSISTPERIAGIEICGWSTHDHIGTPASFPPEKLEWLHSQFGKTPLRDEVYGPERIKSVLGQRDELIKATQLAAEAGVALMGQEDWDLFMIAFGAPHRGGHKLWDNSGVRGRISRDDQTALSEALREVYIACDDAVGRLASAAGDNVTLLVFSLHGMGHNTCRVNILPQMLSCVLAAESDSVAGPQSPGPLKRLRSRVPVEWRNAVKRRLPQRLQDELTSFWRIGDVDLSKSSAFSLVADLQGYVRINLEGREAAGTVGRGDAYDELCNKIAEGLGDFVDGDTGEPVVERVVRSDRLYEKGSRLDWLPDLLVLWSAMPAHQHRAVVAPRHGEILWPLPGLNPDGRSGNHRGDGWLLVRGAEVPAGSSVEGGDILDLAPTVHALLDLAPRPEWTGKVLPIFQ